MPVTEAARSAPCLIVPFVPHINRFRKGLFNGNRRVGRPRLIEEVGCGLTTRCSGLATLAAELDIVRCPNVGTNRPNSWSERKGVVMPARSLLTHVFPIVALGTVVTVLIIFITVTPMFVNYGSRRPQLPRVEHADVVFEAEREVLASVAADGTLFLDRKWFPDAAFSDALTALHERNPHTVLRLSVDAALPYASVRSVLRSAAKAGFTSVTLLTESPEPTLWPVQALKPAHGGT